ncbi:MAG: hypothetical protein V4501_01060 [Pseudomonadota bacterium]
MAQQNLYSNKDSNQNRKLEQVKTFYFQVITWGAVILAGVGFIYYYYTVMERPPIYRAPALTPVTIAPHYNHTYTKNNDSHPYDSYKTPYEQ